MSPAWTSSGPVVPFAMSALATYALTNEVEDRASTFEYLMAHPDELCAMTATDPALAKKVRLLWQRVARVDGGDKLGVTAPCATKAPKPAKKPKHGPKNRLKLRLDSDTR